MADTIAQDEEVGALAAAAGGGRASNARLDIALQKEKPIPALSTDFAKAYTALGNFPAAPQGAYALVFENNFPARRDAIAEIMEGNIPHIQKPFNAGKLAVGNTEHYAVVFEKPLPQTLDQFVTLGGLPEPQAQRMVERIASAMLGLHEAGVVHGSLNPQTITYDKEGDRVMVGECVSNFCGYQQHPAYEAIDQLTCHPAAKGDGDFSPDFFALGMVALFILTGKKPFEKFNREQVLQFRLEQGSCDAIILHQQAAAGITLSPRMTVLLKGLLTDHKYDRWKRDELRRWLARQEVSAPISKMHKQAGSDLEFDGKGYVSRKYLAHDMFQKWQLTQKILKVSDIARWVNLGLKQPHIGEVLEKLYGAGQHAPMLTDERLARIIMILDPEGPIRFQQFSGHIHGIGSYLAWCSITGDRKGVQQVGAVIGEGMVTSWIDMQPNPREYGFAMLGWSPSKLRQYIKKIALGFGMERCLYELNPAMPCQSPLVQAFCCTDLKDVMEALEKFTGNKAEQDPADRHTSAFIAARINLTEDIRIKSLKNFPYIGKIPQVLMVGLLTVAQSEARIAALPKLTAWMEARLSVLIEQLHSKGIKRDMQNRIRQAAKEGKLSSLFKELSDANYARRDLYGFHEARKQYRALGNEIIRRSKQSNIERTAYNVGLRVSVVLAYLICAISALYVMLRTSGG